MAQPRYRVQMMNPTDWTPIEYWEETISIQWSRKINAVGEAKIRVPITRDVRSFPRNTRVMIWREKDFNQHLVGQTIWVVRKVTEDLEDDVMEFLCKDALSLVENRIIAYTADTTEAIKTQEEYEWESGVSPTLPPVSDDMIKEFVYENMGQGAIDTTRRIDTDWFTIEADQALGVFVEKAASLQNLLQTIQDVAKQSDDAGTPVYFDMVPNTVTGAFLFRTWVNFRGRNRGAESDDPLVFSQELENLAKAQLTFDYTTEYNTLFFTGIGSLAGLILIKYENDASLRGDAFARREFTLSDSNRDNDDGQMDSIARGKLAGATATVALKGEAIDTPLAQYGNDFEFGDVVVARARSYEFDCLVEAVSGNYSDGGEKLSIKLASTIPILV